ncbi:hypothetical protein ACTFF8_04735, partial [Campylobacter jejuni]
VVGVAQAETELVVTGGAEEADGAVAEADDPVDMPMGVLLGKPPKMTRDVHRLTRRTPELDVDTLDG